MKNFILVSALLISTKTFAADYTCIPAAIDIYFGDLPTFTLSIESSIDDSGNEDPIETVTATFYSKNGNIEKLLTYGDLTDSDAYAQKHNSNLFLGDTEDRIYVQSNLATEGAGDVVWFTTTESDPSHMANKHRRYQCSKMPTSPFDEIF